MRLRCLTVVGCHGLRRLLGVPSLVFMALSIVAGVALIAYLSAQVAQGRCIP